MRSVLTFVIVYLLAVLGLYLIGDITFAASEPPYHPYECVRWQPRLNLWLPCRDTFFPLNSGQPV